MKKSLTDRSIDFQIAEVGNELNDVMGDYKYKADKNDGTEVAQQEDLNKIIIPKTMNKLQACYNLLKQFKEEETVRKYNRSYDNFFINDFMVGMQMMIKETFGMLHVSKINTDGYPSSPDYVQIPIGYNKKGELKTAQGYVGSITAPCWEDAIIDIHAAGAVVVKAKLKFEKEINKWLGDIENAIRKNSVIRGQAVELELWNGRLMAKPINPKENPRIILDQETERIVANLIIPGLAGKEKTSILLTGDFGTGKTETAIRIGIAGLKMYNRTFFYLHNADLFDTLIPYIKNYTAATIFVEDVDQISAGDRDSRMNDLLNQLDGQELKNVDATFIFTTNNHDKIHPAMRRPGRIDQIVHFGYCNNDMIERIYSLYAAGIEGADKVDYKQLAEATPENLQGAVVAKIADKAVKYAHRLHKGVISTDVFLDAIAGMKHHIDFMKEEQQKDHTMENLMGHVFYKAMRQAFPNIGNDDNVVSGGHVLGEFQGSKYEGLK